MAKGSVFVAAVCLWGCSAAETPRPRVLPSPATWAPGARAEVLDWWGESLVCVVAREGAAGHAESLLWKLDGTSEDGAHGFRVEHAVWSPSGRFLALQLASSGGHQPQYADLVFYDLEERSESDLQDLLEKDGRGLIVTADGAGPLWLPGDRLAFHALSADGEIYDLTCDPASGEVSTGGGGVTSPGGNRPPASR